jgi:hypothetical protein
MNEIRSYASLSGSLLARKGGAKPAMRPRPLSTQHMLDDLGWDDMGEAHDPAPEHVPSSIAALTPAPKGPASEQAPTRMVALPQQPAPEPVQDEVPPVHVQQRVLADHFEQAPVPAPAAAQAPAPAAAPAPAPPLAPAPAQPADEGPAPAANETPLLSDAVIAALRAPSPRRNGKQRAAQPAARKAAFTLRLDADRHLRLRLASALTGRSSQLLVTAALDAFIQTLPEVGALAEQVPPSAGRHS